MRLNDVALRSGRLPAGGCPLVTRARVWVFLVPLFFLFGRRPKDRSLPACDRGRHVPAPRREGRRVKARAPSQEPVSSGIPLDVLGLWDSSSLLRSIASAGSLVVCGVTVQMVGVRRSPGATILGGEVE